MYICMYTSTHLKPILFIAYFDKRAYQSFDNSILLGCEWGCPYTSSDSSNFQVVTYPSLRDCCIEGLVCL